MSASLRLLQFVLPTALAATLSACVPYPVYKTLQPSARATVQDPQSQPLADARVVLISSSYPYGRERSRQETQTAANGIARFVSQSEWRVESMMLHGSESYFWNWCVEKQGYETYETLHTVASRFDDNLVLRLQPGLSRSCDKP
ncbi:carboxypeptidase regulatory-like domain-containing protein [Achromobacter sp. Bel]|nr:carboxypeptidase regulatory-like domain-containing protein [Achromobacter sp. Bel]